MGRATQRATAAPAAASSLACQQPSPEHEEQQQQQQRMQEAVSQLLRNNAAEYRRYTAERAVRALRESDSEKPPSAELRQLSRQAGELARWRHRRRPALLRIASPPHDPQLPDHLQPPAPPYSKWLLDTKTNVLFNVFTETKNPVEDFYLVPFDDVWRTHRYGVYGQRYENYPNQGTILPPHDASGLYYRPNKKMLADPDSARRAHKLNQVVTLDRVKAVAARAVGQFYPKVFEGSDFFNSWPHIDDVLGAVMEYFHHYFELRRVEETVEQLQCLLFNTQLTDARRRRMTECEAECGTIYATYLLGFGTPFHHLRCGVGYRSASASDRHIFEAFLAFVTQCVWIVYRRPNITVISREMGRLFRTAGFDPSRRVPAPDLEPTPAANSAAGPAKSKTAAAAAASKSSVTPGSMTKLNGIKSSLSPPGSDSKRVGCIKYPSGEKTGNASRHQSSAANSPNSLQTGGQKTESRRSLLPTNRDDGCSDLRAASRKSIRPGSNGTGSAEGTGTPTSDAADPSSAAVHASSPPAGEQPSGDSPVAAHPSLASPTDPAATALDDEAGGSNSGVASGTERSPQGGVHVSMKKVYGLYTGPAPPRCAVFGLIGGTTPMLHGALSRPRAPDADAPDEALRCDRSQLGILGSPLYQYDDVLSGIDYEREQKEAELQFMGPSSTRAGVSRVSGIIPYLTLPSKFFSPDA